LTYNWTKTWTLTPTISKWNWWIWWVWGQATWWVWGNWNDGLYLIEQNITQ
jgi:hypothetical protein